jgi:hypothetical protein
MCESQNVGSLRARICPKRHPRKNSVKTGRKYSMMGFGLDTVDWSERLIPSSIPRFIR